MSEELAWSRAWRAEQVGGDVMLTAGGDALYVLDSLPTGAAEAVMEAQASGTVTEVDPSHGFVLDRLVGLGALRPIPPKAAIAGRVLALADADGEAADRLAEALEPWHDLVAVGGPHGHPSDERLVILVRSRSNLADGIDVLPRPEGGALFVDLGHQHTVSIGPWWAGPACACPACYLGRAKARWGELPLPAAPDIGRWMAAVAALIAIQVEAIGEGRSTLVNTAISWDLADGRSQRQTVLKVPWCATCGIGRTTP